GNEGDYRRGVAGGVLLTRADPWRSRDRGDGRLRVRRHPLRDALRSPALPGGNARDPPGKASDGDASADAPSASYRARLGGFRSRARPFQGPAAAALAPEHSESPQGGDERPGHTVEAEG